MQVAFKLGMPNVGSWNGKWTGEDKLYVVIRSYAGKARKALAERMIRGGYYSYNFGDGWRASVSVSEVNYSEAGKLRRRSSGFCGYEWMLDSIERYGEIIDPSDKKRLLMAEANLALKGVK